MFPMLHLARRSTLAIGVIVWGVMSTDGGGADAPTRWDLTDAPYGRSASPSDWHCAARCSAPPWVRLQALILSRKRRVGSGRGSACVGGCRHRRSCGCRSWSTHRCRFQPRSHAGLPRGIVITFAIAASCSPAVNRLLPGADAADVAAVRYPRIRQAQLRLARCDAVYSRQASISREQLIWQRAPPPSARSGSRPMRSAARSTRRDLCRVRRRQRAGGQRGRNVRVLQGGFALIAAAMLTFGLFVLGYLSGVVLRTKLPAFPMRGRLALYVVLGAIFGLISA